LVGKGARGLESDDFAPARMESVRPANLTDLLHNVNNLGLQTGHFGGWHARLAEAGVQGVAAGLQLLATQGAKGRGKNQPIAGSNEKTTRKIACYQF
jgi:hypothetical protein